MIVKICRVHGELTIDQVNRNGKLANGSQGYTCKQCQKQKARKFYEKNADKVKQKHAIYRANNYAKVLESKRESYRKNRSYYPKRPGWMDTRYTDSTYEIDHEGRLALEDWYVRELIAKNHGCRSKDIPQEVVDLKREVVKIKRVIKAINTNQPIEEVLPNEKNIQRNKIEASTHTRGRRRRSRSVTSREDRSVEKK